MAIFIGDSLDFKYGKNWNVHVYGNDTKDADHWAMTLSRKIIRWIGYGKYNLTYVIWKDTCIVRKEAISHHSSQIQVATFGTSVNASLQAKILELVSQAVIYSGSNLNKNAEYIFTKLTPGRWSVVITTPTTANAVYECHISDYWAILTNHEMYGWRY